MLNRQHRRAAAARRCCSIQKKTPFGRVIVKEFLTEFEPPRIVYLHPTKGYLDRRATDQFLWGLHV